MSMDKQLFEPGRMVATPGALALVEEGGDLKKYLIRHLSGDWGDLNSEDKAENDFSLNRDLRIFSAYNTPNGRLWIITEADRSSTTFLLPDEY
jgi:hypothetical protein